MFLAGIQPFFPRPFVCHLFAEAFQCLSSPARDRWEFCHLFFFFQDDLLTRLLSPILPFVETADNSTIQISTCLALSVSLCCFLSRSLSHSVHLSLHLECFLFLLMLLVVVVCILWMSVRIFRRERHLNKILGRANSRCA